MSNPYLHLLFFLLAIGEIVLGIYILVADQRSWRNIGLFLLLVLFGLSNIADGSLITAFRLEDALVWMAVRVATALMLGPAIYLATVMILRPAWLRHRWLYLPIALFTLLAPVLVFLDTLRAGGTASPVLFSPPDAQTYSGGLPAMADLTAASGLLRIFEAGGIFLPALALICPIAVVAWKDRRAAKTISRTAWTLALVAALPFLGRLFPETASSPLNQSLLINGVFLAGILWIVLRAGDMSYGLARIQKSLEDWQVLPKLMLAVLTILIPTVLIITLVASSILRNSLIQQAGSSLSALASVQAANIGNEIQGQIANLQRLAEDPQIVESLQTRLASYDSLNNDQASGQIESQELDWVAAGVAGDFRQNLLITAPQALNELFDFLTTFPNFNRLMLVDTRGGLVTATDIPGHYDFSNAGWWRAAYSMGEGSASVSPPSTRLSDGSHFVRIAVPVRQADTGNVIGVLLGDYALDSLLNNLVGTEDQMGSHSDLYGPSGIIVPHEDVHRGGLLANNAPFRWEPLLESGEAWSILPFDRQSSIVSWAPVGSPLADFSWRLTVHEPVEGALSGLTAATRATAITTALALLLVIGLTYALANYITHPLAGLARAAERIREGDLFVSAPADRKDEFGALAATFNTMTSRLREMVSGLESQVRRRTSDLERQTRQLQAAVQVGQAASTILDQENMLQVTVDTIREHFDLYYVGLFLIDENRDWAVLQAGTGEAGRAMLARGHRMRIGEGMVGWSIQNAQARIADHAAQDLVRIRTSELPKTISEAALPLRARGQTLGALTVQSDRAEEFNAGTINILQTMADQVAIAIDNASLLAENRAALAENQKVLETVRRTYEQFSREAWKNITRQRTWEAVATGEDGRKKTAKSPAGNGRDSGKALSLPLGIRDFPAGEIRLQKSGPGEDWSEDEILLMRSYADQLAQTLESARLFQDTQLRTVQLQTSAEISQAASSILNLEELLPQAVDLIAERFALYYAGIFLVDSERKWAELKAGTGEAGRVQLAEKHRLAVGGKSMVGQCIATGEARIALDVGEEAVRFNNPHLPDTRTEMAIPLTTRGETIGALTIQSIYPAAFSSEDIRVFQTMADQLANAIQNARLYASSQESAEVAQRQSRISQALVKSSVRFSQTQDEEQVFAIVSQEIDEQIRPDQINIFLWEENEQAFRVVLREVKGEAEDGYLLGHLVSRQDRLDLWDVYSQNSKNYNPEKRADGFVHEQYRLPLLLSGKPVGVVEAYHTARSAHIREEDQSIIDGIILQADIALQNARAFLRMQDALSRTEALYRVGQAAIAADEVSAMLQTVVETIRKALPADQVVLFTIHPEEEKVVHFIQTGTQETPQPRPQYAQVLEGFSGWVLREGKPILSTKGKLDRRENERIQRARQAAGFGSVIVVPLTSRGRTMGAITAMNAIEKEDFTSQDADLMLAMANQTAVAVQNAELLLETQKTAENETRLNQIGTQLIQSMDVDTILRTAVEEISRLPNIKRVSLMLGETESSQVEEED